jgi:hypothetical protein
MPANPIAARRRALEHAMLACYELIDRFRKELAELEAKSVNTEAQRAAVGGPTGAQSSTD